MLQGHQVGGGGEDQQHSSQPADLQFENSARPDKGTLLNFILFLPGSIVERSVEETRGYPALYGKMSRYDSCRHWCNEEIDRLLIY